MKMRHSRIVLLTCTQFVFFMRTDSELCVIVTCGARCEMCYPPLLYSNVGEHAF